MRERAGLACEEAARLLEDLGEPLRAETYLLRALRLRPLSPAARLQHARLLWRSSTLQGPGAEGRLLWAAGRLPAAAAALEESLSCGDVPPGLWSQAVSFFVETGEFGRAEASALARSRSSRADPSAAAELARLRLWRGRAADARELALRALAADPGSLPALRALAGAAVLEGRSSEARRALARLLDLAPEDGEGLLWLAELERRNGRRSRALRELERARRAGHDSPAIEVNRTLLAPARDPRRAWEPLLLEVLEWMGGNRSHLETIHGGGALLRAPLRPKARYDRFDPRWSDPNSAPSLATGYLLWRVAFQEPKRILGRLTRLIKEIPGAPELLSHRGELLLWLGRYDEALADFEAMRRLPRARIWWQVARGAVWLLRGDLPRALRDLEEAESKGALASSVSPWKGECLRRMGRHSEAAAELVRARATFPFHVSTWINLALAYYGMDRAADFKRLFHALSEQAPGLMDAARGRGGAREQLESALSLMRGNRSALLATFVPEDGRLRVARLRGC